MVMGINLHVSKVGTTTPSFLFDRLNLAGSKTNKKEIANTTAHFPLSLFHVA